MCLGLPMRVLSADGLTAVCEDRSGAHHNITLVLTGTARVGSDVLVYLGSAIRLLDPLEAQQIADALEAVARAQSGETFDHLIADLVDREPQLPPHLRAQASAHAAPGEKTLDDETSQIAAE